MSTIIEHQGLESYVILADPNTRHSDRNLIVMKEWYWANPFFQRLLNAKGFKYIVGSIQTLNVRDFSAASGTGYVRCPALHLLGFDHYSDDQIVSGNLWLVRFVPTHPDGIAANHEKHRTIAYLLPDTCEFRPEYVSNKSTLEQLMYWESDERQAKRFKVMSGRFLDTAEQRQGTFSYERIGSLYPTTFKQLKSVRKTDNSSDTTYVSVPYLTLTGKPEIESVLRRQVCWWYSIAQKKNLLRYIETPESGLNGAYRFKEEGKDVENMDLDSFLDHMNASIFFNIDVTFSPGDPSEPDELVISADAFLSGCTAYPNGRSLHAEHRSELYDLETMYLAFMNPVTRSLGNNPFLLAGQ